MAARYYLVDNNVWLAAACLCATASDIAKDNGVSVPTLDFDTSMRIADHVSLINEEKHLQLLDVSSAQMMTFFRVLYEKNKPCNIVPLENVRIPKIIHQIWIGKEVPTEFKAFQQSWQRLHPDWQYKLWTQHDIPKLPLRNRDFIDQSHNPGEISDLLRYELLYLYGGVYIDLDFECLRSLEPLHYMYDFYIGIQPLDSELVQLGIGIMGSIPGHPIVRRCIDAIAETWHNVLYASMATARTGPIYCTKVFYALAGTGTTIDIAFPVTCFYPLGCEEYELAYDQWLSEGSFAVHHWAKSWLYPAFRRPEFQTIKNY